MICQNKIRPIFWLLLAASPLFSQTSSAEEQSTADCQVEKSASGWHYLNSQCDIGSGLWGRKPKSGDRSFWLQCNYGKALPNKTVTATVNNLFQDNRYLVPDNGKFRCLIGPFKHYDQALTAKGQLARHGLAETFIRQTATRISVSNQMTKSSTPDQESDANNQKNTLIDNRVVLNSILYSFTFNNIKYHQPRNINSTQEMPPMFINENDQYWSKVNFKTAKNWCQRYGLRLPTISELKDLHTNGQHYLLRHHWPIKSSYWSKTINLYSGEFETLNLRSGKHDEYRPLALLYTTCVTEAS